MAKDLTEWSNGKYTFELFPQEYIDLNKELYEGGHDKICNILGQYSADEVDIKLAQIASYCEVMLDGDYTLENRMQLCKILKEKLVLMRPQQKSQVILLN